MIYFITSNKGKFEEAKRIVPELEMLEIDLPEEQEVDQQKIIERKLGMVADYICTSTARKKLARQECLSGTLTPLGNGPQDTHGSQIQFIVEDTGFYIDCLPGLPGPLIKWFLKTIGRKGIYEICKKFDNFKAKNISMIGYRSEKGEIKFFKGETSGAVVMERGESGFGWDPIFVPDGDERTYAEMSTGEKNEVSMRRKAFEELKEYLGSRS